MDSAVYGLIFFVVGIGAIIEGFNMLRHQRNITGTPTSTIRGAAVGLIEIKGSAVGVPKFTTPISKTPALYYYYEESELKMIHQGRSSRKEWISKNTRSEGNFIFVQDKTGKVRIHIDDTKGPPDIRTQRTYVRRIGRNIADKLLRRNYDNAPMKEVTGESTWSIEVNGKIGDLRYTETYITPGTYLYVLGTKDVNGTIGKEDKYQYVISDKSEEEIARTLGTYVKMLIYGGTLSAVLGCLILIT